MHILALLSFSSMSLAAFPIASQAHCVPGGTPPHIGISMISLIIENYNNFEGWWWFGEGEGTGWDPDQGVLLCNR